MYKFYIYEMPDVEYPRNPKENWILLNISSIFKVENHGEYKTLNYHIGTSYSYVNVLISDEDLLSIFSIMPFPQMQGMATRGPT